MTNTASVKHFLFSLLLFSLWTIGGCFSISKEGESLETLQSAVRQRMLKLQTTDLLTAAAQERYKPVKAVEILAWEFEYKEQVWRAENDPALQALEDAIAYGLLATSQTPEKTAEKVTGALLDYGTALRFLKLKKQSDPAKAADLIAELAVMTGWSHGKVKSVLSAALPDTDAELFPLRPETERLLNERGGAAAFRVAAELYRTPSVAVLLQAERLRRAILNRYLLQTKSSGTQGAPELTVACWRGKLFSEFFKDL